MPHQYGCSVTPEEVLTLVSVPVLASFTLHLNKHTVIAGTCKRLFGQASSRAVVEAQVFDRKNKQISTADTLPTAVIQWGAYLCC